MTNEEVIQQLSGSKLLKPNDLIMDDLQWKYLNWAVLRGKNILFVGPTRSGKTKAAKSTVDMFCEIKTEIVDEMEFYKLKSNSMIKIIDVEEISD